MKLERKDRREKKNISSEGKILQVRTNCTGFLIYNTARSRGYFTCLSFRQFNPPVYCTNMHLDSNIIEMAADLYTQPLPVGKCTFLQLLKSNKNSPVLHPPFI